MGQYHLNKNAITQGNVSDKYKLTMTSHASYYRKSKSVKSSQPSTVLYNIIITRPVELRHLIANSQIKAAIPVKIWP
jgi:hypothetical protein